MKPIRVAIVEDNDCNRDGLRALIAGTPGFDCVSVHASAEHALANLPLKETDVVLVDILLPKMSGVELVRALKARRPDLIFVMITAFADTERVFPALTAGAQGYLLKSMPPAEILASIQEAVEGGGPMSPTIARKVIQYFQRQTPPDDRLATLTDREREILHEVATGYPLKEIATRLGISVETVRNHLRNTYPKLHAHSRAEATAIYVKGQAGGLAAPLKHSGISR